MTKKERAAVVELLRCAADRCAYGGSQPGAEAAARLDAPSKIVWLAADAAGAADPTQGQDTVMSDEWMGVLLEAALRVEQGEWP